MKLKNFLSHWNWRASEQSFRRAMGYDEFDSHTRFAEGPNLYEEHDIGTKNIKYPDGKTRRVKAKKIKDTDGTTFYTFDENTPLT